jgi:hypothetical protein
MIDSNIVLMCVGFSTMINLTAFSAILSFFLIPSAVVGLSFDIQSSTIQVGNYQKSLINDFVNDIKTRLPESIQKDLSNVTFTFKNIPGSTSITEENICHPRTKHKRKIFGLADYDKNQIIVNQDLLPFVASPFKSQKAIDCYHGNLYKFAMSVVIHEIIHLLEVSDDKYWSRYFTSNEYVNLSYGKKSFQEGRQVVHILNKNSKRSPDPYEYSSIEENLAVNFEYYILDQNYPCRRPEKARYFDKVFNVLRRKNDCLNYELAVPTPLDKKQQLIRLRLNHSYIKDIGYAVSDNGQSIQSLFGHSMLIIHYCPDGINACSRPQRFSISFTAYSENTFISYLRGIFGGYPSNLQIKSLSEVLNKMKLELRSIKEYKLKIDRIQKERLLNRVLSYYWEYQSDYKYIANNCAIELWRIIQYAYNNGELYRTSITRPIGILRELNRNKLVDSTPRIYGSTEELTNTFNRLELRNENLLKYIHMHPAKRRDKYLNKLGRHNDIAAYYKLEIFSELFWQEKFYKEAEANQLLLKNERVQQLIRMINETWFVINYGIDLNNGYGIPLTEDYRFATGRDIKEMLTDLEEMKKELIPYIFDGLEFQTVMKELKINRKLLITLQN